MRTISAGFNFSASDKPDIVIERQRLALSQDKRDIFDADRAISKAADDKWRHDKIEKPRFDRIAIYANRLTDNHRPDLGTVRSGAIIRHAEVKALFERAEQENLKPEQLTPRSQAEGIIQRVLPENTRYENKMIELREADRLKHEQKLMRELQNLGP